MRRQEPVRVDVVAEGGVAAVVAPPRQSLFDDRGAGTVRRRDDSGRRDGSPLLHGDGNGIGSDSANAQNHRHGVARRRA